jgi:hypothetical protein
MSKVLMIPARTAEAKLGAAVPEQLRLTAANPIRTNRSRLGQLALKGVGYDDTGDNRRKAVFLQATFPLSLEPPAAIVLP